MFTVSENIRLLNRCYHGGPDYAEFERLGVKPEQVLDFSSNSNPYPYRLKFTLDDVVIEHYPDSDSTELRRSIARLNGVSEESVIVGSGSIEVIRLIAQAFLRPTQKILIFKPTFGEYETACRIADAEIHEYCGTDENEYRIDPTRAIEAIHALKPVMVFICNPNNPTGQYLSLKDIQEISEAVNHYGILVIDEAYAAFTKSPWQSSGLIEAGSTIIVRSLTKNYALAGLRLGYGLARGDVVDIMMKVKPPWNVNAVAQAAGRQAIGDLQYLAASENKIRRNRDYLIKELSGMGFHILPSETNFFLMKVGRAADFRSKLMCYGIIVRDCTSFGLPEYVRIAPRNMTECRRMVGAVKKLGPSIR